MNGDRLAVRAATALIVAAAYMPMTPAATQTPLAPQMQVAPADELLVLRLIWSTMAALQQANETGNYSVLRDLGAPGFQAAQDPATLAASFAQLRAQGLDLHHTLLAAPAFEFPPQITSDGLLRLRGSFRIRPSGVIFDLLFEHVGGRWRLFGIAVAPLSAV